MRPPLKGSFLRRQPAIQAVRRLMILGERHQAARRRSPESPCVTVSKAPHRSALHAPCQPSEGTKGALCCFLRAAPASFCWAAKSRRTLSSTSWAHTPASSKHSCHGLHLVGAGMHGQEAEPAERGRTPRHPPDSPEPSGPPEEMRQHAGLGIHAAPPEPSLPSVKSRPFGGRTLKATQKRLLRSVGTAHHGFPSAPSVRFHHSKSR